MNLNGYKRLVTERMIKELTDRQVYRVIEDLKIELIIEGAGMDRVDKEIDKWDSRKIVE